MGVDERIEALEGDLKLIKGEIKDTLVSMQDFLAGVDLPAPPDDDAFPSGKGASADMPSMISPSVEKGSGGGGISRATPSAPMTEITREQGAMTLSMIPPEETPVDDTESQEPVCEEPMDDIEEETEITEEAVSEKEEERITKDSDAKGRGDEGMNGGTSQVNILGNMLRWVTAAKKQVGIEQLPTLLDVYAMTGYMSSEMKQVILRLADVISEPENTPDAAGLWARMMREQISRLLEVYGAGGQTHPEYKESILHLVDAMMQGPAEQSTADIWNRLILELHGILSIHGADVDSLKLFLVKAEEEQIDEEAEEIEEQPEDDDLPIKLRFAIPIRNGEEKEFSISLSPDTGVIKSSSEK